jgi:tRNA (mo5U34)-methyltransferase
MVQPKVRWFHSFDFGGGEVAKGERGGGLDRLRVEADIVFGEPVAGKRVLDIGAWDGYFSFEAERRGAAEVLATDHFCWTGQGWGTKAGFEYAHAKFQSKVRSEDVDVFDLDPLVHGKFDVVLFLGVLYHLKNPFGGLEQVSKMTDQLAIFETVVDQLQNPEPVLRFYLGRELNEDKTNFFAPNYKCLENMLREVGFKRFKFTPSQPPAGASRARAHVHAWK